ncbi:FAD-dependent oxidoreductase [Mesorhizobium sp. M0204]|uniref:FAD-dependent oxidoreductase n=1 Tax=Mesorhizobium sp. M0204 TaxID=2956913 RepID=UPI003337B706
MRSAQLGFKTAIVERAHLGGICLNWSCIRTKALLRSAEIMHYSDHLKDSGLKLDGKVSPDTAAVVDRSRKVSLRLNGGVALRMKKNKVDVIWGEAKLSKAPSGDNPGRDRGHQGRQESDGAAAAGAERRQGEGAYAAKHFILSAGVRPRALPGIEPDGKLIWTYFEAMMPKETPKSLLVMGSGAIGIEFASFCRTMGADVTVVESLAAVMPVEDAEVSKFAQKQFEKQGMKIVLEAKVAKVEKGANSITAHVEMKDGNVEKIIAARMISAVGVQGNIGQGSSYPDAFSSDTGGVGIWT